MNTMGAWILIFYMSGYNAGGPAIIHTADKPSCEYVGERIKSRWPQRYEGHLCVPFNKNYSEWRNEGQ